MVQLKNKNKVYYARILPKVKIYEVCDLIINSIDYVGEWFVAVDKRDKRSYLFNFDDIDNIVFFERNIALSKVLEAEENAPKNDFHTEYEEY